MHTSDRPESGQHVSYLALGSNIGDRLAYLAQALKQLATVMIVEQVSSVYETEPVGYIDQARFLNLVCRGTTWLTPQELLRFSKDTEQRIGRTPTVRNGPRIIDIDLLYYDALPVQEEQLIIPHPRIAERAFVLVPFVEIAPQFVDPTTGKTAREMLATIKATGVVKFAAPLPV
ncbi:MAG TPA: 2-amino-4-hydroxy-6-hydroxymethyldihydropteridine diphosphokinase [Ktedonobacteraceae bacterium]|nr:2-amino-4-hydroxy-6-hydroxymethyldihydropteridine diphosphokinase [Ktedonobacteraceae bacterium]